MLLTMGKTNGFIKTKSLKGGWVGGGMGGWVGGEVWVDRWVEGWVGGGMGGWMGGRMGGGMGLRVGFININDMYNKDVGKGVVYAYEAYEVK